MFERNAEWRASKETEVTARLTGEKPRMSLDDIDTK